MSAQVQQLRSEFEQQAASQAEAARAHAAMAEGWYEFQSPNPGAEKLKVMMGHILAASPPQPGETMRQSLERAYKAEHADAFAAIKPKIDAEAAEKRRKAELTNAKRAHGISVRSKPRPAQTLQFPHIVGKTN